MSIGHLLQYAAAIGTLMIAGGSIYYASETSKAEYYTKLERQRILIAPGVDVRTATEDDCHLLARKLKLENYVCWVRQ